MGRHHAPQEKPNDYGTGSHIMRQKPWLVFCSWGFNRSLKVRTGSGNMPGIKQNNRPNRRNRNKEIYLYININSLPIAELTRMMYNIIKYRLIKQLEGKLKMTNANMWNLELSSEQNEFIAKALAGNNILVDACIGSGKTTAIQKLCNAFPPNKRILYLTYNRLLKLDAQAKIRCANTTVNNYHGFALSVLRKVHATCGIPELVNTFNRMKPLISMYDVLILDEYQDIEQEFADMLYHIKSTNPQMQIIAVGDMMQKIYDKTTLNVPAFMEEFLGEHITLSFTKCFRLSAQLAEKLGRIWQKEIIGVNDNCIVEEMTLEAVIEFLAKQRPQDILCLGPRTGLLSTVLNRLESHYPEQFNKKTVYASIRDEDSGASKPGKHAAIFTTFDSSKGLERPVCVVFDYTESYWKSRIIKPQTSREILRNIFCVAASRGKQHIIFVNSDEAMLSEESLCAVGSDNSRLKNVYISEMFQFKYKENVEACYALLDVHPIRLSEDNQVIHVKSNDELIDLSPCIGIYQEAVFFGERSLDAQVKNYFLFHPGERFKLDTVCNASLDEKILFLTSLETKQERYRTQVSSPFVSDAEKEMIYARLGELFSPNDDVQVPCEIDFAEIENGPKSFSAIGLADVVKEGTVYELKFVFELTHEHFLQCACYMAALNLDKGILWNTRDNKAFQIAIPAKKAFLDAVAKAVTKGVVPAYYQPSLLNQLKEQHSDSDNVFAVIDTETNFQDQVMSIGIVLADAHTFQPIDSRYYILPQEAAVKGMYSDALNLIEARITKCCDRREATEDIVSLLQKYGSPRIFAYNASFDKNHLSELGKFTWCDIMWLSAYKQFNPSIPDDAEICKSGRLKRGAGVEPTMRRLRGDMSYHETHNALLDALDELEIMRRLGHSIDRYVRPQNTSQSAMRKKSNNCPKSTVLESSAINTAVVSVNEDIPTQCSPEEATIPLCELSTELDSFVSKALSNNPSLLIDETVSSKDYQEAHASLITGTELLAKLRILVSMQPSSGKAHVALTDFCESEVMRILCEIPIEKLSESKSGIRINALKESGYTSIWQICRFSYHQLLAINGIGPKSAENILAEVSRIRNAAYTAIISKPDFAKTASGRKAIREYCRFKWTTRVYTAIGDILAAEESLLEEYCSMAVPVSSILRWIFTFSHKKKNSALQAAAALQKRIANTTQELVHTAEILYAQCSEISITDAWTDYTKSPDEYNAWLIKSSTPDA